MQVQTSETTVFDREKNELLTDRKMTLSAPNTSDKQLLTQSYLSDGALYHKLNGSWSAELVTAAEQEGLARTAGMCRFAESACRQLDHYLCRYAERVHRTALVGRKCNGRFRRSRSAAADHGNAVGQRRYDSQAECFRSLHAGRHDGRACYHQHTGQNRCRCCAERAQVNA